MVKDAHPQSSQRTDVGHTFILSFHNLRSVRTLNEALVNASRSLAAEPGKEALLLLINPDITTRRLQQERDSFNQILRPEIRKRLHLTESRNQKLLGLPHDASPELQRTLSDLSRATSSPTTGSLGAPDYNFIISEILIHRWFMNAGPITSRWLAQTAGCSYPTVASVLKQIGSVLTRHSDRRVELNRFPIDQWARMLAVTDRARHTRRYVDQSGRPFSPDPILRRIKQGKDPSIAIAGVLSARRTFPDLDLIGTPRLDLTIHAPSGVFDPSLMNRLDPALKPVSDPQMPANVVLHFLQRKESFFDIGKDGVWADAVESLLDMHEMRLEQQAQQFFEFLDARRMELHNG